MPLSDAERARRYRRRQAKAGHRDARDRHDRHGRNAAFRGTETDPVLDLLEALPRVRAGRGVYSHIDRARDFIAVFNGASDAEQGRRVLSQIHQICDPVSPLGDADRPGTLAMKAGMRRVMHEIMLCFVPKEPVTVERTSDV